MGLYKYLRPERVDVIENCHIRFTPPREFNDPFEGLPDARLVEHLGWERENQDAVVGSLLVSEIVKSVYEKHPTRWTEASLRKSHSERYKLRLPELKELAKEEFDNARSVLRILSLSEVAPDERRATLLWAHYTQDHHGYVIEFDPENEWITGHAFKEGKPRDSGRVIYSDRRPEWAFDTAGNPQVAPSFYFTKSTDWGYESEYRLIRFESDPEMDKGIVDSLVKFPPAAVLSITVGALVESKTVDRLRVACQCAALKHVRLRRAKIHPDEFVFKLDELKT